MKPSFLTIHFPGKLVFGNGCLGQLTDEVLQMRPSSVLVVTITPLLDIVEGLVRPWEQQGIEVLVYTDVVQEPTFRDFQGCVSR